VLAALALFASFARPGLLEGRRSGETGAHVADIVTCGPGVADRLHQSVEHIEHGGVGIGRSRGNRALPRTLRVG
jgi:hypothetical protein